MMKRAQYGFTIIELMVVLAIAALVIGLSAPEMSATVQRNRVTGESDMLLQAINYARSEAIKRGNNVTICAGSGADAANPCDRLKWSEGWVVFATTDTMGTRNNQYLRVQQQPMSNLIQADVVSITFDAMGLPNSPVASITVCDPTERVEGVTSSVSAVGLVKSATAIAESCK